MCKFYVNMHLADDGLALDFTVQGGDLFGSSWAFMAVTNRAQMKAERASIRDGCLGKSP